MSKEIYGIEIKNDGEKPVVYPKPVKRSKTKGKR